MHFTNLIAWAPDLFPFETLAYRAIDISSNTRCGYYNALYAEPAERENCELVSADDKMVNTLQPTMPFVVHLSTLP